MICPHCHHDGSHVVDSRPSEDGTFIRRRRECSHCGYRFTTFERYEEQPLLVVKKNGARQQFDRKKILNGLVRSAEKRPVSIEQLTKIANTVENKVRARGENEVSTTIIGEYVMDELKDVDEISYIRFASVYRQFKDVDAFMSELESMINHNKKHSK
ncbi:MAG: transcriptional regulator NrdR [[Lactobacillus] timonensis]|jgi:transcriptional repressor NrdR|uniref:transcriptional regulator NrdR n=1 Tax=[Lactobacillus] timonensis TaxID=1970790 RepID=UPI000C83E7D3|nr:transcriptional regulator NrdR [[Lactobacillus] timonensis]MCI1288070.1 transcriptional regulator NrdR [[Lactobacillus] timonensis]MCI1925694.1 transcriptional regulator NrdR [[Lactobacillus] timonensis]MCI1957055.1 transcriptional regulator NrdR [[Lactobacillus] timonensis]MCI1969990.1 transcriptional regulator NrdR [[Lactobacillus] timonensis]MCI2006245.1 transcriptional regulator NrdR [[Lactobacillus] timonensis]